MTPQADIEARFWAKVKKDGPIPAMHPEIGPCWEWTAYKNRAGYGFFRIGKMVQAFRVSWEWVNGAIPEKMELDHFCHNPSCVNPSHLRVATRGDNNHNQSLRKDNTSGFKGVSWDKKANKWRAQIMVSRRPRKIGWFDSPEKAHHAYCEAAINLHGEFANFGRHNGPSVGTN